MRNQLLTNANIGANVLFNQILVFVNYFVKRLLNAQVWLMMSVNIIALAGLSFHKLIDEHILDIACTH